MSPPVAAVVDPAPPAPVEAVLPARVGPWRLHVLEVPKVVRLEGTDLGPAAREFAVPVFVYVPEEGAMEGRLREVERLVDLVLADVPPAPWRAELERWREAGRVAAAWRAARPVAAEGRP